MLDSVGNRSLARAQQAGIGPARRVRLVGVGAAALGLMAASCGVVSSGSGFPAPPRRSPVTAVLVSADGRVITGVGGMACGHEPRLVARAYPRQVTLVWVNPDTSCHAETTRSAVVRMRLPEPLGNRPLARPSGGRIPYFDQGDLARVTVLPARYQFRDEFPAGQPVGDTRTYAGPPGSGAVRPGWPCRCAELAISQQVVSKGFNPPTRQTGQRPVHIRVHGLVAAVLVNGPLYERSISWVDHGYHFTVGVAYGPGKAPLSNAQLIAVANGIRLQPAPDR